MRHPSTSVPRQPRDLRADLLRAAAARQAQLLSLRPVKPGDRVAVQHHASVRRILDEIHAALDRMDAGTYGDCVQCGAGIAVERLTDLPWTTRCESCSTRLL